MELSNSWHMLLSNRAGVPKVAGGALGGSKMGNGTKFKLSNVLPNVFSKIKGMRRNSSVQRLSSAASVTSDCAASDVDQKDFSIMSRECSVSDIERKDFSMMSRDVHGDRSASPPKRSFRRTKNGHTRHTSSPVLTSQIAQESICFPAESPMRSKGSHKSESLSPPPLGIQGSAQIVDPGCCSFDSTTALVPHVDGRVRRAAPQALGKCLIMSKCNSFNGSTRHSDSDNSETDASTTVARIRRHSRAMSARIEGSSSCELYGLPSPAGERASHGSGKVSAPRRSRERRDQNVKMLDQTQQQLYGGSSPIHPGSARSTYHGPSHPAGKYCTADHSRDSSGSERRGAAGSRLLSSNSIREGTDPADREQAHGSSRNHSGRPSRKQLSFTIDDNVRAVDENSFSSGDDFYEVVTRNGNVRRGHLRSQSTSSTNHSQQRHMYGGSNQDTDLDYTSSEVVYTEDERIYAKALLRKEARLSKTVFNVSDGSTTQEQLSRFSHRDRKPQARRASHDGSDRPSSKDSAFDREATLVKTVLNTQGWARENLRALAKANDLDRHALARLKAGSLDVLVRRAEEEAADKIEYERFSLNPHTREFLSWKSSRHPSAISEEVEKYTEGRVDYKSDILHEEFGQPVAVDHAAGDLHKGAARIGKSGKVFGKPWDTEFPSFRSDSILMGAGIGSDRASSVQDERVDCNECGGSPAGLSRRYLERERQSKIRDGHEKQQQDSRSCGTISSHSPSPREDVIQGAGVLKNIKASIQSSSPRLSSSSPRLSSPELSGRSKRLPSPPVQEFSNGKKMPTRTPVPSQEIKGGRRSTSGPPSSVQDFQQVKPKLGRTVSPARSQSPQPGAKPLTAKAEAGMQRLDSVAVVKASYDPYQDFRESMVEMILENEIRTSQDLEDLLQCYLSLNSSEYHKIIVEVFTDVWGDIFDQ